MPRTKKSSFGKFSKTRQFFDNDGQWETEPLNLGNEVGDLVVKRDPEESNYSSIPDREWGDVYSAFASDSSF